MYVTNKDEVARQSFHFLHFKNGNEENHQIIDLEVAAKYHFLEICSGTWSIIPTYHLKKMSPLT